MLLDGNYQFNLNNVLSYHYFGLIEYWDCPAKSNFNPRLDNQAAFDGNVNPKLDNQAAFDGNVKFNSNYSSGGFKVNSFKAEKVGEKVEFTLNYESSRNFDFSFFNPPNGDVIMKLGIVSIKKGANTAKFSINMNEFRKVLSVDSITMGFEFDDKPNWINFKTPQLRSLLNSSSNGKN
jgi:hypothetical protein